MGKSSLSHPLPWTFSNLTVATGFQEAENTERKEGEKTRKPGGDSWSLAPVLQPPPLLARAAWGAFRSWSPQNEAHARTLGAEKCLDRVKILSGWCSRLPSDPQGLTTPLGLESLT